MNDDTHADTIRAGLLDTSNALVAGTMTETAFNGIAALDALVAERDQARMDAADNVAAGPIGRIARRYGWLPADEAESLRTERDRERARADRLEEAARAIVESKTDTGYHLFNAGAVKELEAALSAGSGGREPT